ncbi:MAG TPA: M20 family metallopeptidase [Candidatus Binatia bacterium]|jgi:acetylornithine deacetylase/succinyl-diaminopimelate desuccinylase-like protein|nr:M20 family metallopeptidase [Candidatus Binatia bacterium]
MDTSKTCHFVETTWTNSIVPALKEYLTIPNQSPAYDMNWNTNGYMDQAVELIANWIRAQEVPGLTLNVVRLEGRTPLLFIEIPGDSAETVLLYGHLDKQPPLDGWNEGLGPWKPVMKDGKLYGRGGADDGYAAFASLTAIKALKLQGVPCARYVIVIEACEESGSGDLPYYIDALKDRIGIPSLVICLDSGCGNYDQLWITSSLRGLATGTLTVSTLTEGVHSGAASGVVPSTFRILRQLLSRLEDEKTGEILPCELYVEIPEERLRQVTATAQVLGATVYSEYPFHKGTAPVTQEVSQALLNRTWRPQLEITGAAGLPPLDKSGNVLRPVTAAKVSLRLPPMVDAEAATTLLKQLFEKDPPYGAKVTFASEQCASGWNAPALEPWLEESLKRASLEFFGREACYMGEGGTIPFMAMLGEKFPQAQFMITGVLGPHSNAHGPNEFLDLATGMRLTCCVARVLVDHCKAKC